MALALELADSQADRVQHSQLAPSSRRPWQNMESRKQSSFTSSSHSTHPTVVPNQSQGTTGKEKEQQRLPLIRVSQSEKAERAPQNLCYYCPEKWVAGYVFKQRLLCYADDPEEIDNDEIDTPRPGDPESGEVAHIHAMYEGRRSRPLRVLGVIQNREVTVLIDTGSDRDFLHPKIEENLHFPLSPIWQRGGSPMHTCVKKY